MLYWLSGLTRTDENFATRAGAQRIAAELGDNRESWGKYGSVSLLETSKSHLPALIDQGDADSFLHEQLKTDLLISACENYGYPMTIRVQQGYGHSYFFIASFIEEHLDFHTKYLFE